ncbi:hypothetical protein [Sphingomonas soli]|uniref:hypothetical protein n=1 Tax=Sphingomonas soli TaxID=266127 RepID=UPI0008310BB9|nr:hypothetical protein [Sphingomonas soli]
MSGNGPEDDPLHPSRWKSNWRDDPDGPISGDDLAYLKDLVHSRMGFETERFSAVKHEPAPPPPPPLTRWQRIWRSLRRG